MVIIAIQTGKTIERNIMKSVMMVGKDGTKNWHINGRYHREDGPAIECANGDTEWYRNGLRHREDGPAVEYVADGDKHWYINGEYHREDGPAMIWGDGTKFWYQHGELHCEDGPAIMYASGINEWYLNDEKLTEEEFCKRTSVKKPITKTDVNLLTPTERRKLKEAGFNLSKHARIVYLYNNASIKLLKLEGELAVAEELCIRTNYMKCHRHTYLDTLVKIKKLNSVLNNTALTLCLSKRKLFNLIEKKL